VRYILFFNFSIINGRKPEKYEKQNCIDEFGKNRGGKKISIYSSNQLSP
jgi:hypothetical protein